MIDAHFTAAYVAAALATAALVRDQAVGTEAAQPTMSVAARGEHPGLPDPVRPAPDRTPREQGEHPTASLAWPLQVAARFVR